LVGLFHFVPLHLEVSELITLLMMHMIRISCFALLIGLIGLTSQTMAVARGQAAATGQVVLCTGAGIQTISIDAEGNPTQGGHLCPDCVLYTWDFAPLTGPAVPRLASWTMAPSWVDQHAISQTGPWGLGARGPPVAA
jgi:hypothetical protein